MESLRSIRTAQILKALKEQGLDSKGILDLVKDGDRDTAVDRLSVLV
jgi:hypothetical protein